MFSVIRYVTVIILSASALVLVGGCDSPSEPLEPLPDSVGYLRASGSTFGKLVIFDAESLDIFKTVYLPKAQRGEAHNLERDDQGRIWIGYSQEDIRALPWGRKQEVLVFSPTGEIVHKLKTECGPPKGGIALSDEYAFIGCVRSLVRGTLVVVDMETMEIVNTAENIRPEGPGLSDRRSHRFWLVNVKEIAGNILLLGKGAPQRLLEYYREQGWSGNDRVGR